jgi:ketosteroid isomerase-like protein
MHGSARWTGTAWASFLIACALVTLALPARAQDHVAEQDGASQVRAALTRWRDDFNAGKVEPLCDIFAPDLVVTYRGTPDRGYAAFCRQLQTAVADPALDLRYDLEIEEIIPPGVLVVARVIWTLTSRVEGAEPEIQTERGMDIFRRQADGAWRIARFIAYDDAP